MTQAEVGIVVVSYNSASDLADCLQPWIDAGVGLSDIIVVDNASSDASATVAEALGVSVLANAENVGFAAAANQGIALLSRSASPVAWIVLLNPDTYPAGALGPTLAAIAEIETDVEVVLPWILGSSGPTPNAVRYPDLAGICRWLWDPHALETLRGDPDCLEANYMIGSVLILRTSVWRALDGLSEAFFLYGEDADLSRRLSQLQPRIHRLDVPIRHAGNAPLWSLPVAQQERLINGIALYNRRWHGRAYAGLVMLLFALGLSLRAISKLLAIDRERAAGYVGCALTALRATWRSWTVA